MSHYLNRRFIHKIIDKFMPNNCRNLLDKELFVNHTACLDLVSYLRVNERDVVALLKNDRRSKERTNERTKMDKIS